MRLRRILLKGPLRKGLRRQPVGIAAAKLTENRCSPHTHHFFGSSLSTLSKNLEKFFPFPHL